MPPSGYDTSQTVGIRKFLGGCWKALKAEASEKGETVNEALVRECASIRRELKAVEFSGAQSSTLALTLSFYSKLLERLSRDSVELDLAAQQTLDLVEHEILAIHIPEVVRTSA